MTKQGKYELNDVVKFYERNEPCVVYRVVDPMEAIIRCELLGKDCPHVKLEVIGYVPVELIELVTGHYKNMFALDKILWVGDRTN